MAWRHLGGARGVLALGLLSGYFALWAAPVGHAQTVNSNKPAAAPAPASAPAATPAPVADSSRVSVLDGMRDGAILVDARGGGETQVRIAIKNTTPKVLKVVLPPGLVAASMTSQPGGLGGLQSMGLGALQSQPGAFGRDRSAPIADPQPADVNANGNLSQAGFRSIAASEPKADDSVTLAAGQTVNLVIPSVCLNFGLPDPKPQHRLVLMSVDEYSQDVRVRSALRALNVMNTSRGVAQAAMWNLSNGMTFPRIASEARRLVNLHEVALARSFVNAIDSAGAIKTEELTRDRLFVRVQGDKQLASAASRLSGGLQGKTLMGLPVVAIDSAKGPQVENMALMTTVQLAENGKHKVLVQFNHGGGSVWQTLGQFTMKDPLAIENLDGAQLAKVLDRQIAANFVAAKSPRKTQGKIVFKVENKLPFTIAKAVVSGGDSFSGEEIELTGLNVGPRRSMSASAKGSQVKIERVELNGL